MEGLKPGRLIILGVPDNSNNGYYTDHNCYSLEEDGYTIHIVHVLVVVCPVYLNEGIWNIEILVVVFVEFVVFVSVVVVMALVVYYFDLLQLSKAEHS